MCVNTTNWHKNTTKQRNIFPILLAGLINCCQAEKLHLFIYITPDTGKTCKNEVVLTVFNRRNRVSEKSWKAWFTKTPAKWFWAHPQICWMVQSCSTNSLNLKYLSSPAVRVDDKSLFYSIRFEFGFHDILTATAANILFQNVAAYDWFPDQVRDDGYREPHLEEGVCVNWTSVRYKAYLLVNILNSHGRDIIYYVRTFCKERFMHTNQMNTPLRGVARALVDIWRRLPGKACNALIAKTLRCAAFYVAKGRILRCKRPHIGKQKAASQNSSVDWRDGRITPIKYVSAKRADIINYVPTLWVLALFNVNWPRRTSHGRTTELTTNITCGSPASQHAA